jgi:hypothetical protein
MRSVPGLAKISERSISGLRTATANARHAPRDSPTRYMGLLGEWQFSDLTVCSTNFTRSEPIRLKKKYKGKGVIILAVDYIKWAN